MRFPTTAQSSQTLPLLILLQQNAVAAALSFFSSNPLSSLGTDIQTPNQNLLTYLSTIHDTSTPKFSSAALCTSLLSRDGTALLLPSARIPLSSAGFIDCFLEKPQGPQAEELNQHRQKQQQLVFTGIPVGWQFSTTEITVGGWLDLEKGSFVERVSVSLIYPVATTEKIGDGGAGASSMGHMHNNQEVDSDKSSKWEWDLVKREINHNSPESQTRGGLMVDQATALTPYGRFGTGYRGRFDLSMPVKSSSGGRGKRDQQLAVSPCSTGIEMEIALGVELWFALSNEQIEFDDSTVHRGRLGGEPAKPGELLREGDGHEKTFRIGMKGEWKRC